MNSPAEHQLDRRFSQIEDPFVLDDLRQMEYAKNYNKWLYTLIKPYIGKRVLEIGAGVGNMSKQISVNTELLVGIEPNPYCAAILEDSFKNDSHFILLNSRVEECNIDELNSFHFDTVVCINVLEHIKKDYAVLEQFEQLLIPGGRAVILVPAIPQAYGPIDASLEHFRRYTKLSMQDCIQMSGNRFTIVSMFYSNMVGLLGWFINAHIRRSVKQNDSQIKIFDWMVPIISKIEQVISCPIGLSLIIVLEKGR
jgi:SAM-dependent methyltransferase